MTEHRIQSRYIHCATVVVTGSGCFGGVYVYTYLSRTTLAHTIGIRKKNWYCTDNFRAGDFILHDDRLLSGKSLSAQQLSYGKFRIG